MVHCGACGDRAVNYSTLKKTYSRQTGFTLVELSVVLVIVAFVVAGGLSLAVATVEKYPFEQTQKKLATIEKTMLNYRKSKDRLPCPAVITLAPGHANFGKEAEVPGNCTTGAAGARASFGPTANVVAGMIPTSTLQLPDDYAFDGWGRRFLYVVDNRITEVDTLGVGAFVRYSLADTSIGAITIKDLSNTNRTDKAIYAILSHGKNGHGAFPMQGGVERVNANQDGTTHNVGARELDNCDCGDDPNIPAYPLSSPFPAIEHTFYQQPLVEDSASPANDFDDIITYKIRSNMRSDNE